MSRRGDAIVAWPAKMRKKPYWKLIPSLSTSPRIWTIVELRMADVFTKAERSKVMAAVRSTGNKATELKLVSILRAHSITGWRRGAYLAGKPDFVFKCERVAVFVDGCFWHGCRHHYRMPRSNRQYWLRKKARNAARDRLVNKELRHAGWRVLRIWGHSLRSPHLVARRIISRLNVSSTNFKNPAKHDE